MTNHRHLRRLEKLRAKFEAIGAKPLTARGQNFLLDKNQVNYIAGVGELSPEDLVLEVGPGTGFLTAAMAPSGCAILGVELDKKLIELAREETRDFPNVVLMQADILAAKTVINPAVLEKLLELRALRGGALRLKCVSNLPYSAGTPFVANLFSSELPWARGVFLLQLEVAKRLAARPGDADYGSLSIAAAFGGRVKIERKVPPQVFWPRPRVESAVVRVDFLPAEERLRVPWRGLRRAVSQVFSSRRKSLRNSLKGVFSKDEIDPLLERLGLSPEARGEGLSPEQFRALGEELERRGG